MRLWGPNREKWKTFDFHYDGVEAFRHRAKNHGTYLLEITSLNNTAGDYEIYLAMAEKEADALPDLAQQVLNLLPPNQPGMAFGVIQKGELKFLGARGLADVKNYIPLDLHLPFHVQNLSFPMYAHAFLELEKQGLVDLDTSVSEVLPWFPNYDVEITLEDLISIHSGLPDYLPLMNWIDGTERSVYSPKELIQFLSVRQAWKEQSEWTASPSNTDEFLIQQALCVITGKDLGSSMDSLVFKPLGMEDARMEAAASYPLTGDIFWGLGQENWGPQLPRKLSLPFLTASAQDLAVWYQFLTSPASELPGAWDRLRAWEILPDFNWEHRLRSRISAEEETVLFVKSFTYERHAFFEGYGVWGSLFEGWPLQKPGRNIGLGGRGGRDHLRYPADKIRDPFCGEYQCDQGDLRISITKGDRHLLLSDGSGNPQRLLVARDRESLFTEDYTVVSNLIFGELEGERYKGFTAQLWRSGRATFRRVETEAPEDE